MFVIKPHWSSLIRGPLYYYTCRLVFDTEKQRVVFSNGLIYKSVTVIPFNQISSVTYNRQSIADLLFGTYTLIIKSKKGVIVMDWVKKGDVIKVDEFLNNLNADIDHTEFVDVDGKEK